MNLLYSIMTGISDIVAPISAAITPVLLGMVTLFINAKLYKIKSKIESVESEARDERDILSTQLHDLSSNYSAEKRILKIATEAECYVDRKDVPMMGFIKACVDASIYFYNQLTARPLKMNTAEDIEKSSLHAISFTLEAVKKLEPEYVDLIWDDFERKAVDVRAEFEEIFSDDFNRKEDRFIDAITKYLFDQLKTTIKQRHLFNSKIK